MLLGGKGKDSGATAVAAGKKGEAVQGLGRMDEEERIRALAAVKGRGRDGG